LPEAPADTGGEKDRRIEAGEEIIGQTHGEREREAMTTRDWQRLL